MTISILVRSQVKDFNKWKEHFDRGAEFAKAHGVIASQVLRDLDNPNLVIVHHKFAETDAAKAYMALLGSEAFREGPVKLGGIIPETVEAWMGEEV